jgi:hypothetical protein
MVLLDLESPFRLAVLRRRPFMGNGKSTSNRTIADIGYGIPRHRRARRRHRVLDGWTAGPWALSDA